MNDWALPAHLQENNATTVTLARMPRATGDGGGRGGSRGGNQGQTGSGYGAGGGGGYTAYGSHDTGSYGYGHGHHSGYGHGHHKLEKCPEGIPIEQAILGIAGAAAAAFGILFRAVTQATATKRRRKRRVIRIRISFLSTYL